VAKCQYASPSFDLWMSKGGHDIFALVMINFLSIDWQPKHVTLGLFLWNGYFWLEFGQKID
jgi:hypothetical protein